MIEDATRERRKRGDIAREMVKQENGGHMPRMRAKADFTPYEMRIAIIDEAASVHAGNEAAIKRSLRRRLTKLDRALSDDEAKALDRAFRGWLLFEGRGKSVDPMAVHGGSSGGASPISPSDWPEAEAYVRMVRRLKGWPVSLHFWFCITAGLEVHGYSPNSMDEMLAMAKAIKEAYEKDACEQR